MTKPISFHLTTGTFNYVVKDPDSSRLSGELWIKDSPEPVGCPDVSSNLMRCVGFADLGILYTRLVPPVECASAPTVLRDLLRISNFVRRVNHFDAFSGRRLADESTL
jgi:hypothetical protein